MSAGASRDLVLDAIKAELEQMSTTEDSFRFSSANRQSAYIRNRTADRIVDALTRDPTNATALADLLPGKVA